MAERIEMWPLSRLVPYDRNPRTHSDDQVAQIAASIVEFGFTNPVLVDSDNGIVAGHGRLRAARRLGLTEIPVIPLDHLTEEQRRAYVIADNKLAENAGWDTKLLHEEIEALASLDYNLQVLGFSDQELGEIRADLEEPEDGATDQDDAPALPESADKVVSRPGDVWICGPHRLYVGDMLSTGLRASVTSEGKAALIVTDPPYNVEYVGMTDALLEIKGD